MRISWTTASRLDPGRHRHSIDQNIVRMSQVLMDQQESNHK
jgi:hypothetical protein